MQACWHPLTDVVLAGRYPDPNFPGYKEGELRTIDFYCPGKVCPASFPGLQVSCTDLQTVHCMRIRIQRFVAMRIQIWDLGQKEKIFS